MSFFDELKRRKVIRVGIAYAVTAWLLIEIAATTFPMLMLPDWTATFVTVLLIIGFPIALIFTWAFEVTPEGIKRDADATRGESGAYGSGRKLDFVVIGFMALGIVYLIYDNYLLDEPETQAADEIAIEPAPIQDRIMLAVLPLANLSDDPEQEYFSDGLTEEMITQLGYLPRERLGVIARTSSMYYKGQNKRVDEIGQELGVDYVLEGSVRRIADSVRITATLIQVSDQARLWTDSFERDFKDIFALQSEIARRITHSLALEFMPADEALLPGTRPVNAEAYDAYLKGRYYETRGNYSKAFEYYEDAIQKDPNYALPYAAIGHTYAMQMTFDIITVKEGMQKHWDYTRKAEELAPGLAEVEVNYADMSFYGDWDWSAGEAGFRRAYESNPASEGVAWHYAICLQALGRFDEAIEVLERALELDPYSHQLNSTLANVFIYSRQHTRAIEQLQNMTDMEPENAGHYQVLGQVFEKLDRLDEAVEAYLQLFELTGNGPDRQQALWDAYKAGGMRGFWLKRADHLHEDAATREITPLQFARVYSRGGDKERALEWLDKAIAAQTGRGSPISIATIYADLGEENEAVATLEKAVEQRSPFVVTLRVSPRWDALRDNPRFQDLVRRMNLPD